MLHRLVCETSWVDGGRTYKPLMHANHPKQSCTDRVRDEFGWVVPGLKVLHTSLGTYGTSTPANRTSVKLHRLVRKTRRVDSSRIYCTSTLANRTKVKLYRLVCETSRDDRSRAYAL